MSAVRRPRSLEVMQEYIKLTTSSTAFSCDRCVIVARFRVPPQTKAVIYQLHEHYTNYTMGLELACWVAMAYARSGWRGRMDCHMDACTVLASLQRFAEDADILTVLVHL